MTHDLVPPRSRSQGAGLALIGYRGAGKSTVGRILADRVGRVFLDMDKELQIRVGRSAAAIFAEDGQAFFRDCEERTLAEILSRHPTAIVATGGGAILREANRRRLGQFGFVVWLTADSSELARRVGSDPRGFDERPSLTSAGTIGEIGQVLEARKPLYEEVADAVIETAGKTPDEVATAIMERWTPQV
jgi:shikimate kinase